MLNIETFFNTKDLKRFFFPGRIFWGKDCRHYLHELIEPGKTIALFVDAFFAKSDFIHDFQKRYAKQIVLIEKIEGLPKAEQVKRVIEQLGNPPNILVSVGGGSTMDAAKAVMASFLFGTFDGIGIGARRGIRFLDGIDKPTFICLPTTAGTGADSSRYYVVYDSKTHTKIYGRSWKLVADWILLDPYFIRNLTDRFLVNSAFDAFIHFFESYLCRYERSWCGEMLSLDCMTRIFLSLDRILQERERDDEHFLQLLYSATMAGVAISNIRTGLIHEAGGALLEHTSLSHSETLFVFFRETCELYIEHMEERVALLLRRFNTEYPKPGWTSLERIIQWWEEHFEQTGITDRIIQVMRQADAPMDEIKRWIYERVHSDRVWVEQEGPMPLDDNRIRAWIAASLGRFGI